MRRIRWVSAVVATTLVVSLGLATPAAADLPDPYTVKTMTQWYHTGRGDYLGAATPDTSINAVQAGYHQLRTEALVAIHEGDHGSVPLWLFYSDQRQDYFLAARPESVLTAFALGYRTVRIEGYVYPTRQVAMIPLYTYFNAARGDYLLAAKPATINEAIAAGYVQIRVEGYGVPTCDDDAPPPECPQIPGG